MFIPAIPLYHFPSLPYTMEDPRVIVAHDRTLPAILTVITMYGWW